MWVRLECAEEDTSSGVTRVPMGTSTADDVNIIVEPVSLPLLVGEGISADTSDDGFSLVRRTSHASIQ